MPSCSSAPTLSYTFFFPNPAPPNIYTLSLHDALPICLRRRSGTRKTRLPQASAGTQGSSACGRRSEEHTSELQSPCNLVCRLLLEKNKLSPILAILPQQMLDYNDAVRCCADDDQTRKL